MNESFKSILLDPAFQGLVLSPLIGIVLSFWFNPFINGTNVQQTTPAYSSVSEITYNYKITVSNYQAKESQAKNGEDKPDALAMGILALGAGLFLIFIYVYYSEIIFRVVNITVLTTFFFAFTLTIISIRKKAFRDSSWWSHIGIPFLLTCYVLFLLKKLQIQLEPRVVELAKEAGLKNFMSFGINTLTNYGRIFLLSQPIGLLLTLTVHFYCLFNFLHYMAFVNYQANNSFQPLWKGMFRFTRKRLFDKSWQNLAFLFFWVMLSYIFVSRLFTEWILESTNISF